MPEPAISDEEYRALAAFRAELRRFLQFSEDAARAAGLSPRQHQLLLAIRGHPGPLPPTVGDLATALHVKPHSMVGLVNRMVQAGYLQREPSTTDQRTIHVVLTATGNGVLQSLTAVHRGEHDQLDRMLRHLMAQRSPTAPAGEREASASDPSPS